MEMMMTNQFVLPFRYTYGKPVKGNVTIAVYPQYRVSYIQPFFTEPVRKTVPINGKVDVDFNLLKELKWGPHSLSLSPFRSLTIPIRCRRN